jgi:carboxylate-amine ligase
MNHFQQLIHLLANWFNDNGSWLNQMPTSPLWFSRENKWRAIRHGLNADLIINSDGEMRPIAQDILMWLEKLEVYEKKLGYKKYVKTLCEIVEKGNSSTRQRKIHAQNNSLHDVAKFNVDEFLARKPIW